MDKIKDFLAKPIGMIALLVVGFGAGFYVCKRKKRRGYAGR
ncbi:hypothetical protein [Flavobacterium glycines]|nr:hypothetical protein [Flavobacterium glycines]